MHRVSLHAASRATATMMSLALLRPPAAVAQDSRIERITFDTTVATPVHMRYLVDLPAGYGKGGTKWPLVLFLHGAGERGNDLDALRSQGLPKLAAGGSFPFILVSPQVPPGEVWSAFMHWLLAQRRTSGR